MSTHLQQVNVVLGAESLDKLDVVFLLAVGGEDAEVSLTPTIAQGNV